MIKLPVFDSLTNFDKILDFLYKANSLDSLTPDNVKNHIADIEKISKSAAANVKLSFIRKALNYGTVMDLTKGSIWYPCNPFITIESQHNHNIFEEVAKFKYDNKTYILLGDRADNGAAAGLGYFHSNGEVGLANASVGCLGCSSEEIAKHFSLYFWKEIFEAKYADYIEFSWV